MRSGTCFNSVAEIRRAARSGGARFQVCVRPCLLVARARGRHRSPPDEDCRSPRGPAGGRFGRRTSSPPGGQRAAGRGRRRRGSWLSLSTRSGGGVAGVPVLSSLRWPSGTTACSARSAARGARRFYREGLARLEDTGRARGGGRTLLTTRPPVRGRPRPFWQGLAVRAAVHGPAPHRRGDACAVAAGARAARRSAARARRRSRNCGPRLDLREDLALLGEDIAVRRQSGPRWSKWGTRRCRRRPRWPPSSAAAVLAALAIAGARRRGR